MDELGVLQKMKRIFLEAFSAAFLTFGAIGVLNTITSIKAHFTEAAHKGVGGGFNERLSTSVWILVTVVLLGIAFYVSHHARRLRRANSDRLKPTGANTE